MLLSGQIKLNYVYNNETIITFTNDALPDTFFQVYKIINLRL